jgi:hypothetical protein
LLTLYITPVFYIYMERSRGAFGKMRKKRSEFNATAEPAVIVSR